MRQADGISRALSERHESLERERKRALRQLLGSLRRARERREEWYVWVVEGMPILTAEQYAKVGRKRATKRQSA